MAGVLDNNSLPTQAQSHFVLERETVKHMAASSKSELQHTYVASSRQERKKHIENYSEIGDIFLAARGVGSGLSSEGKST